MNEQARAVTEIGVIHDGLTPGVLPERAAPLGGSPAPRLIFRDDRARGLACAFA